MSPKIADVLERGLWTLAQAAAGFGLAEVSGVSTWWSIPAATALSVLKNFALNQLPTEPAAEEGK